MLWYSDTFRATLFSMSCKRSSFGFSIQISPRAAGHLSFSGYEKDDVLAIYYRNIQTLDIIRVLKKEHAQAMGNKWYCQNISKTCARQIVYNEKSVVYGCTVAVNAGKVVYLCIPWSKYASLGIHVYPMVCMSVRNNIVFLDIPRN